MMTIYLLGLKGPLISLGDSPSWNPGGFGTGDAVPEWKGEDSRTPEANGVGVLLLEPPSLGITP